MCTDTSSYLHDHQFFACTDDDTAPAVLEVLAEASELGSVPVYEACAWIARKVWKSKSEDVDLQLVMAQSVLASSDGGGDGDGNSKANGKAKTRQALTAHSSHATVEDEAEAEDDSDVDDYPDDEYFDIKPRDGAAETAMKLALKRCVSFLSPSLNAMSS